MNLKNLLQQKLADWRFDTARQTLTVSEPGSGHSVTVTADCADRVGCRVWELTVTRPAIAPSLDLKTRAERLAARATGLMEPLRLLELDAERDTALLRSVVPLKGADELSYYEIVLHGRGAAVRRFEASTQGGARRQIAFPLTHEALAKLADDLAAD